MTVTTQQLRYHLPAKAIKSDCPQCGPRHRKTLSRYVDSRTNEALPEHYGRCDRESNCTYHLSPYHKTASGLSYADEVFEQWKADYPLVSRGNTTHRQPTPGYRFTVSRSHFPAVSKGSSPDGPVHSIPEEVFTQSLGHYERNQFARLLRIHLGYAVAEQLLHRYHVGTSSYWPGACVFWYIDEQGRKRGGQIKLFDDDWHTVKYIDREGKKRSKTSWVHTALLHRYKSNQMSVPEWLTAYEQEAGRSPCLFGFPQLPTLPADYPVAIVEAPKTAILCAAYFPQFAWLAIGSKSYLNAERLASVRGRKIVLFPDLNAYDDLVNDKGQVNKGWLTRASELQQQGFTVKVSDYLESRASNEHKAAGLDLADYLLDQWKGCPPDWHANEPGDPPTLISSPNQSEFARVLGIPSDQLPLYQLFRRLSKT